MVLRCRSGRRAWRAMIVVGALLAAGGGCGGEGDAGDDLTSVRQSALESVDLYLGYYCGCFLSADAGEGAQASCVEDTRRFFPFSGCDDGVIGRDEVTAVAFYECLRRDASRGATCLISCDASLGQDDPTNATLLACDEDFRALDNLDCLEALTVSQRADLVECARDRQAAE